ncbi:MAG: RNA polymerase sigma factor [Nannocystaceae bacterium]
MFALATVVPVDGTRSDEHERAAFHAELALTRGVASGDRQSAAAFARRLLPHVRRVANALLGDSSDAEDATQNALVELLRSAQSYRGLGTLEGWAHRITVRAALRWMKQQRRRAALVFSDAVDGHGVAEPTRPLLEALPRPIEVYLDALPEVQRTALLLRHALGHTVPEIAELTDAPVATVKSRLLKGQRELRKHIRRDMNMGVRGGPR